MVLDCLRVVVDVFEVVVEFFEVVVGGCRWFYVVPCFSNHSVAGLGTFSRDDDFTIRPNLFDLLVFVFSASTMTSVGI